MKKIEHQIFLKRNKLAVNILLQPIQEKIEIFNRMYQLLEKVTNTEKEDLLDQLEILDLEILDDIDEEYADRLEFNTLSEDDIQPAEPVLTKHPKPKVELTIIQKDESILDELVKMKCTRGIGRSKFIDLGLKTTLGWNTVIGKYLIKRTSAFNYRYKIELNS